MSTHATTGNEDVLAALQDMMQITSDGFIRLEGRIDRLDARMDGLEGRMDGLEGKVDKLGVHMNQLEHRMGGLEASMHELQTTQTYHTTELLHIKETLGRLEGEQKAQSNDIVEILDRIVVIEARLPNITAAETRELQANMQAVVDWVSKASKLNHIPINFPRNS